MSPLTAPPLGRNAFADPLTGDVYLWHRNHSEEQAGALARVMTNLQPVASHWRTVRAIRQQAGRDEGIYKLAGTANEDDHAAFLAFQSLSQGQTIYFFHAAGERWECLLSDYEVQRKYVGRGPGASKWIYVYTMQLDVFDQLPT